MDRPIGLLHATAMVVGIIIGASIFVQPSEINRHVPTISGVLAVWLAAGILTLFGSLVCAELSSVYPRTGGVYVFLKETLSPACGFLWGWAMFWSAHSGIIAASSMIFARYVGFFVPLSDTGIRAVAIAGILLLSFINYLGVRQGSMLQTLVTGGKVIAIALLLLMVVAFGAPAAHLAATQAVSTSFREFVLGVSAALFAFGGWHMVTYTAGETRNPAKTIPRALLIGCLIVTTAYVALNAAYLYLLPLSRVTSSTRVAADAAFAMAGSRGAALISALVVLSAVGVLNGVILAGPRTYYAMAEEGLAFRWLARIHPRFHTPSRALWMQAAWSCTLVATGTYRALFTRVVYTEWLFFALMSYGLIKLRRSPGYAPGYRAWGYPWVQIVFAVAAVIVAAISIAADPVQAATGLLLVVLGLPVYYLWVSHANH
ncbi:Amino acid permease-associated region [Candidatus Sulfopaludibacter sp. SbA3]|nr:Amino acid permease-associated region [Candidatus Sulfopaludibacter sp. SbA3]